MGYVAVRTERHTLIHYRELAGMDELYDLEADPYELTNLAGHADAAEVQARLSAELRRLLQETQFRSAVQELDRGAVRE